MKRELQQIRETGEQVVGLSRRLAGEPALRRNPLPLRLWQLGQDLVSGAQHAAGAEGRDDLREGLSVVYRAGTELVEMHRQFERTVSGQGARSMRTQLALAVGRLQDQLHGLAPAVAEAFGAWEARFVATPPFHGDMPAP